MCIYMYVFDACLSERCKLTDIMYKKHIGKASDCGILHSSFSPSPLNFINLCILNHPFVIFSIDHSFLLFNDVPATRSFKYFTFENTIIIYLVWSWSWWWWWWWYNLFIKEFFIMWCFWAHFYPYSVRLLSQNHRILQPTIIVFIYIYNCWKVCYIRWTHKREHKCQSNALKWLCKCQYV